MPLCPDCGAEHEGSLHVKVPVVPYTPRLLGDDPRRATSIEREAAQNSPEKNRGGRCPNCGPGAIFGKVMKTSLNGTTFPLWVCLNCSHRALRVTKRKS